MLFNRRLTGRVSTKQFHHAGTKNICGSVILAAKRWSKYECAIQEWTRGSPFISSFPGEYKLYLLNELLKIMMATLLGHFGWPCGRFPVLICWRQRDQAQANYRYEPVYICAPFTQSYSSTASGSPRKAKEGQKMAGVGSSCVKAFRYSVESHSSNLKSQRRQLLSWHFAINHTEEHTYFANLLYSRLFVVRLLEATVLGKFLQVRLGSHRFVVK